jgi:hypothetical protein
MSTEGWAWSDVGPGRVWCKAGGWRYNSASGRYWQDGGGWTDVEVGPCWVRYRDETASSSSGANDGTANEPPVPNPAIHEKKRIRVFMDPNTCLTGLNFGTCSFRKYPNQILARSRRFADYCCVSCKSYKGAEHGPYCKGECIQPLAVSPGCADRNVRGRSGE